MTYRSRVFTVMMMVIFILIIAGVPKLQAAEKVKCAVSGKEINKEEAVGSMAYKGTTYYFCCAGCEKKFKEDPEMYVSGEGRSEHMSSEHMEQEQNGEVVDPVCGMTIKKDEAKFSYEYKGTTYYFCMEGCKDKFVKNPEEYIKAGDEMVTCSVSGEEIKKSDAAGSMEYKGKAYYFCCAGCKEKFEKNPEEYIKKSDGSNGGEHSLPASEGACCSTSIKKK
jgi:YHS domain-containing protein